MAMPQSLTTTMSFKELSQAEFDKKVLDAVNKSLPPLISESDVEKTAIAVFESRKDKKQYADKNHRHSQSDVDIDLSGYAKNAHTHKCSDIVDLDSTIKSYTESIKIPDNFAEKNHTHDISSLTGKLSFTQLSDAQEVVNAIQKTKEFDRHSHPTLEKRIEKLEGKKDPVIPEAYDDTELRDALMELENVLKKHIEECEKPVEISIEEVKASKVMAECEYIIIKGSQDVIAYDSTGKKIGVKVTSSGDKYLLRPDDTKNQPITFTFPSPPIVCGIATSKISQSSSGRK